MPSSFPPNRPHPITYTRTHPQHTATPSATTTLTTTSTFHSTPVLRLRAQQPAEDESNENGDSGNGTTRRRRVQWAEGVVNNEGMGKKRSKVCCIYHRPRVAGESSDESSSSSDSDSESGSDGDGSARPSRGYGQGMGKGRGHRHESDREESAEGGEGDEEREHDHDGCDHDHVEPGGSEERNIGGAKKRKARKPSPNAYERQPKNKIKPSGSADAATNDHS